MGTRWITFDCFGTLVDWNAGFAAALTPIFGERTREAMSAYHTVERELEAGSYRPYREVLAEGIALAAQGLGRQVSEEEKHILPRLWATLPVFPDVERMLAELRREGCKLGVLTNCDEDLFAETHRQFRHPFDVVITAEGVCSYKPALAHFEAFPQKTGASRGDWIHVACSWFHDIAPARSLGIRRIWLDRDLTGEDPAAATARVLSADEVPRTAERLFRTSQATTTKAIYFNAERVDLDRTVIAPEALRAVPRDLVLKYRIVPLYVMEHVVGIGLTDPSDLDTIDALHHLLRREIEPKVVDEAQLEAWIQKVYG